MPLVYLPDRRRLFLWDEELLPLELERATQDARETAATLVVPPGKRQRVEGRELPLELALAELAALPAAVLGRMPASLGAWSWAAKLALELVVRERLAPALVVLPSRAGSARQEGRREARWRVSLLADDDAARVTRLARAFPPAAHAVPLGRGTEVWAAHGLIREFLDAAADELVRAARREQSPEEVRRPPESGARGRSGRRTWIEVVSQDEADLQDLLDVRRRGTRAFSRWLKERATLEARAATPWEERWLAALAGAEAGFEPEGFAERSLVEELERWSEPALGDPRGPRTGLRLELPAETGGSFTLRSLLQAREDPSLVVEAQEFWSAGRRAASFEHGEESLLRALGRAAQLFPALERALAEARPTHVSLTAQEAHAFLVQAAPALAESGLLVQVPGELTTGGRQRLRLKLRIGGGRRTAGVVAGESGLGLGSLVELEWRVALGDAEIGLRELRALAKQKASLVLLRDQWVAVDPRELERAAAHLAEGSVSWTGAEALRAALAGRVEEQDLPVEVEASGAVARTLEELRAAPGVPARPPAGLAATLRPYQLRGLGWLSTLAALGLGGCLADDMGLGKTLQAIAFLLARRKGRPRDKRPALVVVPTSVVGNWEREIARFAPGLVVVRHHGPERAREARALTRANGAVVVTSYGTLRLDAELLAGVDWSVAILDEAQNAKNAASATARAARRLRADVRIALSGTPMENRLAELWSILEFTNPGLLGSLEAFRRRFALPIERYGDPGATEQLRRLVAPFLLRRVKTDPTVIADLPPKQDQRVICTLTREQASLYQATCDAELEAIATSAGMQRRGRVLALLGALKQICNHPAQFLREAGPLGRRSGKLERLVEMLEEVCLAGDQALVFTQYRQMGERLVAHLEASLGPELARGPVLFLHGGTARGKRDDLVDRFQDEARGPRVFVLSLKAGGTGLNLTAASHVFHFDRWWNPAVEDQATDRAHRIGQRRTVQVHRFLCAGTLEERIDELIERKRGLAASIVGAGETWITELGDEALRELVALGGDAVLDEDEAPAAVPGLGQGARRKASSGRSGG